MEEQQAGLGCWRRRLAAVAAPTVLLAALTLAPAPLTAAQPAPPAGVMQPKVLGWGFAAAAMTRDGSDLFVANGGGPGAGSVTELATSTGALMRVMAGSYYHFDEPSALAVYGGYLFVANEVSNSVRVPAPTPDCYWP